MILGPEMSDVGFIGGRRELSSHPNNLNDSFFNIFNLNPVGKYFIAIRGFINAYLNTPASFVKITRI